jgi:DNA polymerase-1
MNTSINWNSPQQVKQVLASLGVVVESTAEVALTAVVTQHPLVPKLLAYREASKLATTYGRDFVKHVHAQTGRIHAEYRQIGADTGRMACSRPNLQQVPHDPSYRACFRPADGRVLVKADLSLIELCVAAELSGDQRMIAAITNGEDLHRLTAAALFGKVADHVTREERAFGKAVNFGTLYGQGRKGLMALAGRQGLALSEADARAFQRRFAQAWPELIAWQRRQMAGTSALVHTASGRVRRLAADERGTVRANTPVQGTAADGFKVALARLWETRAQCPSGVPVLAVHDELVIECNVDEVEAAVTWVTDALQTGMQRYLKRVPVRVEVKVAPSWAA